MDSELWDAGEVFFVIYGPALVGLVGFLIFCLSAVEKLPKSLRTIFGVFGIAILLTTIILYVP